MKDRPKVGVAVDIETLSRRASGVVVAVGLAAFTVQGGLLRTAQMPLDITQQIIDGRDSDPETLKWWGRQSETVRRQLEEAKSSLALHPAAFTGWFQSQIRDMNVCAVYGYGSDFDNAMLQDLCLQYSQPAPWHYRLNRCGRTILAGRKLIGLGEGEQHVASEDAVWLATNLRNRFLELGENIE